MLKFLIGLFLCVGSIGYSTALNEISAVQEEKDVLIAQNIQLTMQVEELADQEFSLKEKFKIAAEVYSIDEKMLYAIAKLETGNFTSSLFKNNNNPGGIKSGSGWAKYDTEFQGIMEMARLLKKNYIDKGLNTPEKIGPKYCPNSDSWAKKVRSLME